MQSVSTNKSLAVLYLLACTNHQRDRGMRKSCERLTLGYDENLLGVQSYSLSFSANSFISFNYSTFCSTCPDRPVIQPQPLLHPE